MIESYLDAIIKIANSKALVDKLEPNLMWHQDIQKWQVKRVMYAFLLLEEEMKKWNLTKNVKSL